jgi:chemotaxis signal transduction protein
MGRPRPAGETSDRFLVCQVAAVTVALPVDMAREVVHVAPEAWAAVPSPPCRHATQEALVDARPMLLLDLTALVSEALAVADPR